MTSCHMPQPERPKYTRLFFVLGIQKGLHGLLQGEPKHTAPGVSSAYLFRGWKLIASL